jgi:hypothetical protein
MFYDYFLTAVTVAPHAKRAHSSVQHFLDFPHANRAHSSVQYIFPGFFKNFTRLSMEEHNY